MGNTQPDQLLAHWRHHPVLRAEFPQAELLEVFSTPSQDAVALILDDSGGGGAHRELLALGEPQVVANLLTQTAEQFAGGSVPRGTMELLTAAQRSRLTGEPGVELAGWDFLYSDSSLQVPPDAPMRRIEVAAPSGELAAEVREFLAVAYPRAFTDPGDHRIFQWWIIRDSAGSMAGVIGALQQFPGAPVMLCSLGVDPKSRGEKLGSALMVRAVNDGLQRPQRDQPIVGLGVYADNSKARSLYEHLGLVCAAEFESW